MKKNENKKDSSDNRVPCSIEEVKFSFGASDKISMRGHHDISTKTTGDAENGRSLRRRTRNVQVAFDITNVQFKKGPAGTKVDGRVFESSSFEDGT